AIVADADREAWIGMERRVVLDLRALAELDPIVVAAQDRAEPDAGIGLEAHPADHGRGVGHPIAPVGRQFRPLPVKLKDRHVALPVMRRAKPAMRIVAWRGKLRLGTRRAR